MRSLGRQDMPQLTGIARVGAVGLITAISALDGVGAVGRGLGLLRHKQDGANANAVLSYHGNKDRLGGQSAAA